MLLRYKKLKRDPACRSGGTARWVVKRKHRPQKGRGKSHENETPFVVRQVVEDVRKQRPGQEP